MAETANPPAPADTDAEEKIGALSPETKEFFDKAGKPEKKKPAEAKPEDKPEAKPEAKKDDPETERANLKRAMDEERNLRKEMSQQLARESDTRKKLED